MEVYTSKEASEVLGIGFARVNKLCSVGEIKGAYKENRKWIIPKESLDTYIKEKEDETNKIVGERFGELTILEVLGYRQETETQQRLYVKVGCECGNIVDKPFYTIERGAIKCCGNECITKSGFQPGDRYGHQTIIDDDGFGRYGNGRRHRVVKTICDCGSENTFALHKLKSGEQVFCGKSCKMKLKDIIGTKYGFLTIIEELDKRASNGDRIFLCECECGKEREKTFSKLIMGETKYCWHDCELKRGEDSAFWNNNISMEERVRGRDYWEYEQWRKKVFTRDKFTCKCCNKRGNGDLAAHHLDGYNWCVEKRTEITNGVTICISCHSSFHKNYGYGDNTKEQFEKWLSAKLYITETECKIIKEKVSP